MLLNLVFHDIVKSELERSNKYTVTVDYFHTIISKLQNLIENRQSKFSDFRVYFDDGRISFANYLGKQEQLFPKFNLAIITDLIDTRGYLSSKQLAYFQSKGVTISSHGTSHAALAIYENDRLIVNPWEGEYQNSETGKGKSLTKKEVLYQAQESKKKLENILGTGSINEFVFPYGLYNELVIKLIQGPGIYNFLSTCDEKLDDGSLLRPRFLIDNEKNLSDQLDAITKL